MTTVDRGSSTTVMAGGLLAQQLVEAFEQRAAAGQHDTAVHDVGGQFRGRLFQGDAHGLHDAFHLFGDGFAHFLGGDDDVLRDARHQVAALDLDLLFGIHGIGRGDLDFDLFRRASPMSMLYLRLTCVMMASSILSRPRARSGIDDAGREMTATSVVPPPMSTTMLEVGPGWAGRRRWRRPWAPR